MSLEQLESTLLQLPPEERRRFARWFYEHEDDLAGPDGSDLHPEVQAEVLRRRDEALAHPEQLDPWEGTVNCARQRLNEVRRQKAQGR